MMLWLPGFCFLTTDGEAWNFRFRLFKNVESRIFLHIVGIISVGIGFNAVNLLNRSHFCFLSVYSAREPIDKDWVFKWETKNIWPLQNIGNYNLCKMFGKFQIKISGHFPKYKAIIKLLTSTSKYYIIFIFFL